MSQTDRQTRLQLETLHSIN